MEHFRGRITLFLFFLLLMFGQPGLAEETVSRISMNTGDTKEINTEKDLDLHVNRKGILSVLPRRGKGRWLITALKPGFVALRSGSQQWLVTVEKDSKTPGKDIPDWICQSGALHCDRERVLLSGTVDSWDLYFQSLLWCHGHKTCLFLATLSQKGQKQWEAYLRDSLPWAGVSLSPGSPASLSGICQPEGSTKNLQEKIKASPLLHSLEKAGQLRLVCEDRTPASFQVKARVILVNESLVREEGFKHTLSVPVSLPASGGEQARLLSVLQDLARSRKARIIAEPLLILREGIKGLAKSGGEMPVSSPQDRHKHPHNEGITWKSYGIHMEAMVIPLNRQHISLNYEVRLSLPGPDTSGHLTSELFKSEILLKPGEPVLAGQVGLNSRHTVRTGRPLLEKIPLLGPLFRGKDSGLDDTSLMLWFEVKEAFALDENTRSQEEATK